MLGQNLIQFRALHALLKRKASRQFVQFFHALVPEQLGEFLLKALRQERLQHCPFDVASGVPRTGVRVLGRWADPVNPLYQWPNKGVDLLRGVLPPRVELKSLFLLEKRREQLVPRR